MTLEYFDDESSDSLSEVEVLDPEDIDMDAPLFEVNSSRNGGTTSGKTQPASPRRRNLPDFTATVDEIEWAENHLGAFYYDDEERGKIGNGLVNGCPCTIHFLEAIIKNFKSLRNMLVLELCDEEGDDESSEISNPFEVIAEIMEDELSRLEQHPELFPDQAKEHQFWLDIYEICTDAAYRIPNLKKAAESGTVAFEKSCWEERIEHIMPFRDSLRTPWEQYLHNRAPGMNVNLAFLGDGGSVQILSMAAVRIMTAMVDENIAVISDIESKRPDKAPYQNQPMPGNYSTQPKPSPDGNIRSHHPTDGLLRPFFVGSRDVPRFGEYDSLPVLNQDFIGLTGRRSTARSFNVIGVMIRDRPNPNMHSQGAAT